MSHSGSHKSFRPLAVLSFRFNRHFSGFNPWSYHLTNILLHTLTTWLFVRVARVVFNLSDYNVFHNDDDSRYWTTNQNFALFVSSLLFASHPIHTEAVAGVVGRADVGATALALSSFLAYVYHVKLRNNINSANCCQCEVISGQRVTQNGVSNKINSKFFGISNFTSLTYLVISVVFAAASMLCKEHGIMIIFICAAYDLILSLVRFRRNQVCSLSFVCNFIICRRVQI